MEKETQNNQYSDYLLSGLITIAGFIVATVIIAVIATLVRF